MTNEYFECRLCLNSTNQTVDVFKEGFVQMIELLSGIKVIQHNNLTSKSCFECHSNVELAVNLRSQIIKSNEILLRRINNLKSEEYVCKEESIDIKQLNILAEHEHLNEFVEVESKYNVEISEVYSKENSSENDLKYIIPETSEKRKRGRPKKFKSLKTSYIINSAIKGKPVIKSKKRKDQKTKKYKKPEYKINPEHIEFLKKVYNKKEHFPCPICNKDMLGLSMKRHLVLHSDDPVVCDTCGEMAKNPQRLLDHIKYYHKTALNICDQCGKSFKSEYLMIVHKRKEHDAAEPTFECAVCGRKFFEKQRLRIHINVVHRKIRQFKCQHCGKEFGRRHQLNTHLLVHTTENRYNCHVCGKGFKIKHNFITHLRVIHGLEEEKTSVCPICNKGFSSIHGLKTHINSRVHGRQKCDLCSEIITVEFLATHLKDIHGA